MKERNLYRQPSFTFFPCDWYFHWEDKTSVTDLELKGLVVEAAYDQAYLAGFKPNVWYKPWTWNNWVSYS